MSVSPQTMVDAFDAAIQAFVTGDQAGIQKAGDSIANIERYSLADLRGMREYYAKLAYNASSANGGLSLVAITNLEPGAPGASLG